MSQRSKRDTPVTKNRKKSSVLIPVFLYLVLYVGSVVAGVASTSITPYDFEVGDICDQTITAPYDFIDEYSTNLLKEEEMQKVTPIYKSDEEARTESLKQLDDVTVALESTRIAAKQIYMQQDNYSGIYSPGNINWDIALTAPDLITIKRSLPDYITDQDIFMTAALSQEDLSNIKTSLVTRVTEALDEGIVSDSLEEAINGISADVAEANGGRSTLNELIARVLSNTLKANRIYDAEATEVAKQAAADAVANVEYKTGENIVRQGERITQKQYEIVNQLGLTTTDTETMSTRWISGFMIMGAIFGIAFLYCFYSERSLITSTKNALSLTLLTAVTIGITMAIKNVSFWIIPIFLPSIVATAFLKTKNALAYSAFISVVTAFVMSEGEPFFFSSNTVIILVSGILGSAVAILTLQKKLHRGEYILSGLYAGVINGLINSAYGLISGLPVKTSVFVIGVGVGNGIVCGLLAVGLLPIWEYMFSLDTPSKLLEIASPGNELLKNLMVYAPGTYHHSIMVANLAEAGTEAVGGNALLSRVSAYYHDIGKLQNPNMFSENQINIANPHDELTPEKSAEIIIAHVRNGKTLADKNKLPKAVKDIIVQHHGSSLVSYFYYHAKQQGDTDQRKFRYPGPKPQTKEAGVVMLADTVEAAIRANNTLQNGGNVDEQIDKLIKAKYDDGQLDECPLNRRDLMRIKEAFLSVFSRANHERIVYPEDE